MSKLWRGVGMTVSDVSIKGGLELEAPGSAKPYKLLTARSPDALENKVCEAIGDGWLPQGGVSIGFNDGSYGGWPGPHYIQAVVRAVAEKADGI